jgi:hypothetical protein
MSQDDRVYLENRLTQAAQSFLYPSTPDIVRAVRVKLDSPQRLTLTWKLALAVVLAAIAILLAVPEVRAGLVGIFRIGVVRIFPATPTPTPTNTRVPVIRIPTEEPTQMVVFPSATPDLVDLFDLFGETTLESARQRASFPIPLPTYPSDLGVPDRVYYQPRAKMIILVWMQPDDPQKVRISLHMLGPDSAIVKKMDPQVISETSVNGQYAVWTTGPYPVQIRANDYDFARLVEGHTLIWEQDNITYRLETDLSLEEAVRIAESLK